MPLEDQYLLYPPLEFPSGPNVTLKKIYETLLYMALPWKVKDLMTLTNVILRKTYFHKYTDMYKHSCLLHYSTA